MIQDLNEGADDVLDLFSVFMKGRTRQWLKNGQKASYQDAGTAEDATGKENSADSLASADSSLNLAKIYSFDSLNHLTKARPYFERLLPRCKFPL